MANTFEYKCPACGASIVFDSATQHMKCPYCETELDPRDFWEEDSDLADAEPSMGEAADDYVTGGEGLRVYVCESCGGEIVTDETTSATSCPFCGNAVVLKGNLSGEFKPDLVVPFRTDKNAAKEALVKFCKKKPLLPSAFLTEQVLEEVKGVYVPFWLYSAEADADMTFRATRSRRWSDFRKNYVETSYFRVERTGSLVFDGVPVDGSSKMSDSLMDSLEPFDWSEAVDFGTAYLSGYFADKYDETADDCAPRAEKRMTASAEKTVMETVTGYETVTTEKSNVSFSKKTVKYGLLPVWMLTVRWKDKAYTYAMNGQTGRFTGRLPVSRARAFGWFFAIAAAVTAICVGISYLL